MDDFGITNTLRVAYEMSFRSARHSGRSTRMLENFKEGDRIVVISEQDKRFLLSRAKEMKKDIDVVVVNSSKLGDVFMHATPTGRTIFDHRWVENFYLQQFEKSAEYLRRLQDETSGYGEPHRKTVRKYQQSAGFGWDLNK